MRLTQLVSNNRCVGRPSEIKWHVRRRVRHRPGSDNEAATDPDNVPPRSRLFVVVPKNANSGLIQVRATTF